MKLSHTPLLLALFPLLAAAAPANDHDDDQSSKITRLAPVKATASRDEPGEANLGSWGNASLRNTPAAVSIIDREQIDNRQIRTLSELAREDSSLGDNYAPVGYYQNIAIRGYPLDPATGYRINNLTATGEQLVALEDKQQVEVLKGLGGLAAGVMEPGGVVNFVSKRTQDVRTLTLGTDSEGSRYTALDMGGWLTPTFGMRANVAWDDAHSHIEHANGRRNFYALAADWKISHGTTLELDSNYQASAQRSVSGYQLLGGKHLPSEVEVTRMLGYQPWQQPVSIHAANSSARLNHAFSENWQFRLAAGRSRSVIDDNVAFAYGCFYAIECADGSAPGNYFAPNGDYDVYDFRSPGDTRVSDHARATLEGRFDTGTLSHELSIGIGSFHRTITRSPYVYDYVGTGNINDTVEKYFPPSPNQPGNPVRRFDGWQRSVFAMDRMRMSEHWQLIAGGNHVRMDERTWSSSGKPKRDSRLEKFLPQAAVLWQPTVELTAYASYSEGLSLGMEAPYWTSNDGEFLAPRLSRQVESGVKYRWNDSIDFNAALFRIHQPYQFAQPDASSAGFTFVQRGEEVHTGLELSANGQLSANLSATAGVSLIQARAQNTGTPSHEGHQVVNVPRLRSSLHLDYQLPSLPALGMQGGWRYASSNVAKAEGSVRVDAHHVFDAGLRYRGNWQQHSFVVQLGVDNLFSRFYWRDTGSVGGDNYLFPGAPRLARLSVSVAL